MKNVLLIAVLFFAILSAGCSKKPTDIVFGSDPGAQMLLELRGKLPKEDYDLLTDYLQAVSLFKMIGGKVEGVDVISPTGRTVGQVLADAKYWREKTSAKQAERKKSKN